MINVVIVDDEILAIKLLKKVLVKSGVVNIVGEFTDSASALREIATIKPDVAYLDVGMPGMNGIELGTELLKNHEELDIVFVTAYEQYAIEAFKLNAMHYILKPINQQAIDTSLERITEKSSEKQQQHKNVRKIVLFGEISIMDSQEYKKVNWVTAKAEELFALLIINRSNGVRKWELMDILWGESEHKLQQQNLYTTIHRLKKTLIEAGIEVNIESKLGVYRMTIDNVFCDLFEFEKFVKNNLEVDELSINDYESAIALYQGGLFGNRDYTWIIAERETYYLYYLDLVKRVWDYYVHNNAKGKVKKLYTKVAPFLRKEDLADIRKIKKSQVALLDKNQQYQRLIENTQSIIFTIDQDGIIKYASPSWKTQLGHASESVVGKNMRSFIHEDDGYRCVELFRELEETKKLELRAEYRICHMDGTFRWHKCTLALESKHDTETPLYVGNSVDITEQKNAQFVLEQQHSFQAMVTRISSNFITGEAKRYDTIINQMLKEAGEFFGADRAYLFLFSQDRKYLTNTHEWCARGVKAFIDYAQKQPVSEVPWWRDRLEFENIVQINDVDKLPQEAELEQKLFKSQDIKSLISIKIESSGLLGFFGFDAVKEKRIWTKEQVYNLKILGGILSDALSMQQSVKILGEANEKLKHMANHDMLTGLPNKRYFSKLLKQAILEAKEAGKLLIIFYVDLDKFKQINDTYGHYVGDELLVEAGKRMSSIIRNTGLVARLGGDEFAFLLKDIENKQEVITIAERIIAEMSRPFSIEEYQCEIGATMGIVMVPKHGEDEKNLLTNADKAMYRAKQRQRGSYCFACEECQEGCRLNRHHK